MNRAPTSPDGRAAKREAKLLDALTTARQQLVNLAGDRGAAADGSAGCVDDVMRAAHLEVLRVVDDAIEGPFPALEAFACPAPGTAVPVLGDGIDPGAAGRGLAPAEWADLSDDLAELSSYVGAGLPDRVDPATIAKRIREGIDILMRSQFDDAQRYRMSLRGSTADPARSLDEDGPERRIAVAGALEDIAKSIAACGTKSIVESASRMLRASAGEPAAARDHLVWEEDAFRAYNRAFDFHVAAIGDRYVLRGPLTDGGSFVSMQEAKGRAQSDLGARLAALAPCPEGEE